MLEFVTLVEKSDRFGSWRLAKGSNDFKILNGTKFNLKLLFKCRFQTDTLKRSN